MEAYTGIPLIHEVSRPSLPNHLSHFPKIIDKAKSRDSFPSPSWAPWTLPKVQMFASHLDCSAESHDPVTWSTDVSTAKEQDWPQSGLGLLLIFPFPVTLLPLPANQFCINKLYVPGFARWMKGEQLKIDLWPWHVNSLWIALDS